MLVGPLRRLKMLHTYILQLFYAAVVRPTPSELRDPSFFGGSRSKSRSDHPDQAWPAPAEGKIYQK